MNRRFALLCLLKMIVIVLCATNVAFAREEWQTPESNIDIMECEELQAVTRTDIQLSEELVNTSTCATTAESRYYTVWNNGSEWGKIVSVTSCDSCISGNTPRTTTITQRTVDGEECVISIVRQCDCAGCDASCVSDSTYSFYTTGYERKIIRTCECSTCLTSYQYRCASGYYGTSNYNGTSGCKSCRENKIYTDWTSTEQGYQRRQATYPTGCNMSPEEEYRCAPGYYSKTGTAVAPTTTELDCTRCPIVCDMQSNSDAGATSVSECCVDSTIIGTDISGEFELRDNICAFQQ